MKADFRAVRALPVLAGSGLALVLAACSATTYGTGTPTGMQTINDIAQAASILGNNKDPINFTPRPPVVAPPNTAVLPPPGNANTAVAGNWPNDPDLAAAQAKALIAQAQANGTPITVKSSGADTNPVIDINVDHDRTTPEQAAEYKRLAALRDAAPVDASGNPVRVYLSDPPSDYLKPDPTAPDPTTVASIDPAKKKFTLKWPWQWFQNN